ncbi:IreB family regulatory phosphoprotein, partial [Gemella sp.]
MTNFDETRLFDSNFYDKNDIHNILKNVVETIKQRGYDPINQLMGYIKTADPVYIP